MQRWEDLTISNDFLFSKLMRNKETCKEVLEVLLNFKIGNITYIEDQKSINIEYDAKSIRLDIYVEAEDKVYNVEMQVVNHYNLPKRSRYYQDLIDLAIIEKGEKYNNLKDSFVIFICAFDPFDKGLPRYTFENICVENPSLKLNDGTQKIFFNAKEFAKEENENIKAFLQYINGEKTNNEFINKLDDEVERIKQNKDWRVEYMTLEMKFDEKFEQGRQQGMEQGMEQGIQQGIINTIEILKNFNLSMEEIIKKVSEQYNLTKEQIKKYL